MIYLHVNTCILGRTYFVEGLNSSDWRQTLRNVTETISPPFDAQTEEMKRNYQNIFGLYKTLTNLSR